MARLGESYYRTLFAIEERVSQHRLDPRSATIHHHSAADNAFGFLSPVEPIAVLPPVCADAVADAVAAAVLCG